MFVKIHVVLVMNLYNIQIFHYVYTYQTTMRFEKEFVDLDMCYLQYVQILEISERQEIGPFKHNHTCSTSHIRQEVCSEAEKRRMVTIAGLFRIDTEP